PAAIDTPVTITSSNPSVASVPASVTISQGSRTATIAITAGVPGTATLTFSVGAETIQLTVLVGPPFTGLPPVSGRPVGVVLVSGSLALGRVFTPTASQTGFALPLLSSPASS